MEGKGSETPNIGLNLKCGNNYILSLHRAAWALCWAIRTTKKLWKKNYIHRVQYTRFAGGTWCISLSKG